MKVYNGDQSDSVNLVNISMVVIRNK